MCGIAGVVQADSTEHVPDDCLLRMARALRHRGPDGFGLATGPGVGLVSTRLAVVDLEQGWQPLVSEVDGSVLVYNGEVYDHPELRTWLEARGERCRTRTDTEVVLRLLVREGLAALERFNGQFALADIKLTAAIPEPTTTALLALGLLGLAVASRRRASM